MEAEEARPESLRRRYFRSSTDANARNLRHRESTTTVFPKSSAEHPDRTEALLVPLTSAEMQKWVATRSEQITSRWHSEVIKRLEQRPEPLVALIRRFFETFVHMLPAVLGPYRRRIRPLWRDASVRYGQLAAERGLAAGEVIEEFQVLRISLIRVLFTDPNVSLGVVPSMREVLRLNRLIDQGITHATIGYTNTLFSALISGHGVPQSTSATLLSRAGHDLDLLQARVDRLQVDRLQQFGAGRTTP